MKLFPKLLWWYRTVFKNVETILGYVKTNCHALARIERDMETVRWLADQEEARRKARMFILWVTIDPNTGGLDYKLTSYADIANYFGERYRVALDALRKSTYGEPIYIDGAFFMHVQGGSQAMNAKHYNLSGQQQV